MQHALLPDSELHEPKHIQGATTADAGAVITPSASVDGTSELRRIASTELSDGTDVVRKDAVQTLTSKRITARVVIQTDGATIPTNSDVTDVSAVTIAGNRTISAPTGTPTDGQLLQYRITQDATGNRTLTWDAAFDFQDHGSPLLHFEPGDTSYVNFRWRAATSKWESVLPEPPTATYGGMTVTRNATVTAVGAATDAVNFNTAADYAQVTVFDVSSGSPSSGVVAGTNTITAPVTGVYRLSVYATIKASVNNPTLAMAHAANTTVNTNRPIVNKMGAIGDRANVSATRNILFTAGDVIKLYVASDAACNVTVQDALVELTLLKRTA